MTSGIMVQCTLHSMVGPVYSDKVQNYEVGERYIQVWAPDNGLVPFSSIITI